MKGKQKFNCKICKKEVEDYPYNKSKYCSNKCYILDMSRVRLKWFKENKDSEKMKEWSKNISIAKKGISPPPFTEVHKKRMAVSKLGKKNSMWKGDKVSYGTLHQWVKRHKPKVEFCECCGIKKSLDVANINGKYKRDINDFEWLCRICHMKKDGRLKNLIKRNKKGGKDGKKIST